MFVRPKQSGTWKEELELRLIGRDPENSKDTLCRNVTIYGHCRWEDSGCVFSHDPNKSMMTQADSGNCGCHLTSLEDMLDTTTRFWEPHPRRR
ncbi:uncharacterized protein RAG0_05798 [Rhynchosporium agropyri]|uniref:C3H1-type domain-containing protein n=1 Tax=Rhynchosporium agropyri TaxID=914238 RepID=A0A1E1KEK8_9HELO|nr:uncharacterized protein RAG0_05798 [Rhynchosporium agropyri]